MGIMDLSACVFAGAGLNVNAIAIRDNVEKGARFLEGFLVKYISKDALKPVLDAASNVASPLKTSTGETGYIIAGIIGSVTLFSKEVFDEIARVSLNVDEKKTDLKTTGKRICAYAAGTVASALLVGYAAMILKGLSQSAAFTLVGIPLAFHLLAKTYVVASAAINQGFLGAFLGSLIISGSRFSDSSNDFLTKLLKDNIDRFPAGMVRDWVLAAANRSHTSPLTNVSYKVGMGVSGATLLVKKVVRDALEYFTREEEVEQNSYWKKSSLMKFSDDEEQPKKFKKPTPSFVLYTTSSFIAGAAVYFTATQKKWLSGRAAFLLVTIPLVSHAIGSLSYNKKSPDRAV